MLKRWVANFAASMGIVIACALLGTVAGVGTGASILRDVGFCGTGTVVFTIIPALSGTALGIMVGLLTCAFYFFKNIGSEADSTVQSRSHPSGAGKIVRIEKESLVGNHLIFLIGFLLNFTLGFLIWKAF